MATATATTAKNPMPNDEDEDVSWVLDSLVGFLKGPVWNLPILNFIEQKSVIFEPDGVDQPIDALEAEYASVFDDFKRLVDTLLASHMQDLGISPAQFERSCTSARDNLSARLHSLLFEQIWAASNYRIFKRMMIRRNIDLQLQALELLGQRLHLPKETLASSSLAAHEDLCAEEDELMRTILQHTQDLDVKPLPTKTETIVHHDPSATETDETAASEPKDDKVMTDEQVLLQQMHRVNVELGKQTDGPTGSVTKSQPIIEQVLANQSPDTERPGSGNTLEQSNRKLSLIIGQKNDQISADDLKKRQDYLRMQRDKLIELKRKERSKQIVKVGESEMKASRPKSARAVKSTLSRSNSNEDENVTNVIPSEFAADDDKALVYRRTLASRLKAELIGSTLNGAGK